MGIFDFLKSDKQKLKDRISAAMARLEHLIEVCGPKAGPTAALRSLAKDAATIRGGRVRGLVASPDDGFGHSALKASEALELDWWADRACYMGMKDEGLIEGGPDVPGLWDEEMREFIVQYHP